MKRRAFLKFLGFASGAAVAAPALAKCDPIDHLAGVPHKCDDGRQWGQHPLYATEVRYRLDLNEWQIYSQMERTEKTGTLYYCERWWVEPSEGFMRGYHERAQFAFQRAIRRGN